MIDGMEWINDLKIHYVFKVSITDIQIMIDLSIEVLFN